MFVCQWHLDTPYGKQSEALRVMRGWGEEKLASSEFRRSSAQRVLVGHLGVSPSHVVDEYLFDSLADFELGLQGMTGPQFRSHSDALAPFIVPASQHWKVYRVAG